MRRTTSVELYGTVAAFLVFSILLTPGEATSQARAVPVQGVGFNTSASVQDNMKPLVGKDVSVYLRGGKTYQGYVKSIGDHLLHLEKIAGKDLYDALIRIEDISAIEVKFREIK